MNEILNDIKKTFSNSELEKNLKIFFRKKNEWNLCLSKMDYQPYFYSNLNIDFTFEIIKSKYKFVEDFSIIIKNQDKGVSILPLFIYHDEESYVVEFLEKKILPPLFVKGLSEKIKKKIIEGILNFLDKLKLKLSIKSLKFIDNIFPSSSISQWHKMILKNNYQCILQREAFVCLEYDINDIRASIRKSYKSLISKGEKIWKVESNFSISKKIWREFKALHYKAAGRKTRSDKSWEILEKGLIDKDLFFIYCLDKENKMVGGSLFFLTKNESYYAIAAYDRDLFDHPIGHVLQFKAISEFKKMNFLWYRLGKVPFDGDDPKPSLKEKNIGKFKDGFSTHLFPQYTLFK